MAKDKTPREDLPPESNIDPKYKSTFYRGYSKPLYQNSPDVPRDLGLALDEIDADVQLIASGVPAGTNWKGEVPTEDDLPENPSIGDAWLVTDTDHLWIYTESGWVDLGVAGKEGPEGPQGPIGPVGPKGDKGDQGLQGIPGVNGKGWTSGYYTDTNGRVTFTSDDGLGFVTEDLRGEDGESAYEIAVEGGYDGTEEEWLESLKGENGTNGTNGENGQTGPAGPGVAPGGTSSQVLAKVDGTDYNTEWVNQTGGGGDGVPDGGTTNQVLTKLSDTDGDADWRDSQGGGDAPTFSTYDELKAFAEGNANG